VALTPFILLRPKKIRHGFSLHLERYTSYEVNKPG
jgi:hypothetical protein